MTFLDQAYLSKLFIPYHEKNQDQSIRWRLKLIKKTKVYPYDKLIKLLQKGSQKLISVAEKQNTVSEVSSDKFNLDEYDETVLLVSTLLKDIENKSFESVLQLHRTSRILYEISSMAKEDWIKENKGLLEIARNTLAVYRSNLINGEVQRIRSLIALKELIAFIDFDRMIPHLISITPNYLSSKVVQSWIRKHQHLHLFGNQDEQKIGEENLNKLFRSIKKNRHSFRPRKYDYWKISLTYTYLSSTIKGFRKHKKNNDLDNGMLEAFCEHSQLTEINRNRILNNEMSVSELALDIMIDQGLIETSKAFKDFQPYISKLQNKHFSCNILNIANELIPALVDFLDYPKKDPGSLFKLDILRVLELVRV